MDGGRISIAPLADAAALAHLHAACFERPWSAESFENLLSHPGVSALGALADGAPAGFVLVRHVADEAEILTICVLKEARRTGVGRALFQAALSDQPHIRALFIEVDVMNTGAVRFMRSSDFKPRACAGTITSTRTARNLMH